MSGQVLPLLTKVLVGVDGSADAERAVHWAAQLAESTGAEVVVVHVLTFDRELLRDITPDTMTTWRRDLRRDLESTWVRGLVERGIRYRSELVEAESAAVGILDVADREKVDLIVIGPRHHNAFAERLHGSTGARLMHHSVHALALIPSGASGDEPTG